MLFLILLRQTLEKIFVLQGFHSRDGCLNLRLVRFALSGLDLGLRQLLVRFLLSLSVRRVGHVATVEGVVRVSRGVLDS